jgi:hypothetical protein
MNWIAKAWTTPLINREEETTATEYNSESSYQSESTAEPKASGIFDWFWGTPEQDAQSEPEPVQRQYEQATNDLNIQGDEAFVQKVTNAYNYLSADDQAFVRESTKHIMQHSRVSGASFINRIIMLGGEVLQRDEKSIAGVLIHESHHMTYGEVLNSQEEELDCISKQIEALRKIGGCEAEIAALEKEDGSHYLNT